MFLPPPGIRWKNSYSFTPLSFQHETETQIPSPQPGIKQSQIPLPQPETKQSQIPPPQPGTIQSQSKKKLITTTIVVSVVILVLAILIPIVWIELMKRKKKKSSSSSSTFTALKEPPTVPKQTNVNTPHLPVNGDVLFSNTTAQSGLFQFITAVGTETVSGNNGGIACATHEAGFVASYSILNSSTTKDGVIYIYTHDDSTIFTLLDTLYLPSGAVVVDMKFAPRFNVIDEVYFLLLSVGQSLTLGDFANRILTFQYDTSDSKPHWVQSGKGPFYHPYFTWSSADPSVGTFGDRFEIVLDDITAEQGRFKHSLYVRGSQYPDSNMGGSIFWFIIHQNSIDPDYQLIQQIQDEKLRLTEQMYINKPAYHQDPMYNFYAPSAFRRSFGRTAIVSFGASFHVTSGNKLNNILIVGNPSSEDQNDLQRGATDDDWDFVPKGFGMMHGYVQVYTLNADSLLWEQQWSTDSQQFLNRFGPQRNQIPNPSPSNPAIPHLGFGYVVSFINGEIVIGQQNISLLWSFQWIPNAIQPRVTLIVNPKTMDDLTLNEYMTQYRVFKYPIVDLQNQQILVSVPYFVHDRITIASGIQVFDFNTGADGWKGDTDDFKGIGQMANMTTTNDPMYHMGQYVGYWYSESLRTLFVIFNQPYPIQIPLIYGRTLIFAKAIV